MPWISYFLTFGPWNWNFGLKLKLHASSSKRALVQIVEDCVVYVSLCLHVHMCTCRYVKYDQKLQMEFVSIVDELGGAADFDSAIFR